MVNDVLMPAEDGRRDPTVTLTGWRAFVAAEPARFDLLPEPDLTALDDERRERYDEARIRYHSELAVASTSTVTQVCHQGRLLTLLNQRELSARRGLIVSGEYSTGKSTALKALGRTN